MKPIAQQPLGVGILHGLPRYHLGPRSQGLTQGREVPEWAAGLGSSCWPSSASAISGQASQPTGPFLHSSPKNSRHWIPWSRCQPWRLMALPFASQWVQGLRGPLREWCPEWEDFSAWWMFGGGRNVVACFGKWREIWAYGEPVLQDEDPKRACPPAETLSFIGPKLRQVRRRRRSMLVLSPLTQWPQALSVLSSLWASNCSLWTAGHHWVPGGDSAHSTTPASGPKEESQRAHDFQPHRWRHPAPAGMAPVHCTLTHWLWWAHSEMPSLGVRVAGRQGFSGA